MRTVRAIIALASAAGAALAAPSSSMAAIAGTAGYGFMVEGYGTGINQTGSYAGTVTYSMTLVGAFDFPTAAPVAASCTVSGSVIVAAASLAMETWSSSGAAVSCAPVPPATTTVTCGTAALSYTRVSAVVGITIMVSCTPPAGAASNMVLVLTGSWNPATSSIIPGPTIFTGIAEGSWEGSGT